MSARALLIGKPEAKGRPRVGRTSSRKHGQEGNWARRGAVAFGLVVAVSFAITGSVLAFTPGENGHPTSGPYTDLQGRASDVTLTPFGGHLDLACSSNWPDWFHFSLEYVITGSALPAGSTVVVYLSPDNDAIQGNSGGNDAAYIAAVESNYKSFDLSGLSGSRTLHATVFLTSRFQLASGGVRVVIADDLNGDAATVTWTSTTDSLSCFEWGYPTPSPRPTPTPTQTATPTPTNPPTLSPTLPPTNPPTPTLPDTAVLGAHSAPPADPVGNAFLLLLVGSVAALMFKFLPRKRENRPTI